MFFFNFAPVVVPQFFVFILQVLVVLYLLDILFFVDEVHLIIDAVSPIVDLLFFAFQRRGIRSSVFALKVVVQHAVQELARKATAGHTHDIEELEFLHLVAEFTGINIVNHVGLADGLARDDVPADLREVSEDWQRQLELHDFVHHRRIAEEISLQDFAA